MKIVAEFVYPPIPDRSTDWVAYDEDRADAEQDSEGYYWRGGPRGWGPTKDAALDDLRAQYEDDEELTPEIAAAIEACRADLGNGLYETARTA